MYNFESFGNNLTTHHMLCHRHVVAIRSDGKQTTYVLTVHKLFFIWFVARAFVLYKINNEWSRARVPSARKKQKSSIEEAATLFVRNCVDHCE